MYMRSKNSIVAQNNKAHYEYFIETIYEAGIVLQGTEVKSLRKGGNTSLLESHVTVERDELFLLNMNIPEYTEASRFNHYARRPRKLLLHRYEIKKLIGFITKKGMTVIPLKVYFDNDNIVKITIAVAKGKKIHDKRETIKAREWERNKNRLIKEGND